MENVAAKQRMLQPSSHHHVTAAPKARPEGTRDGDKQAAHLLASPQSLLLPHLGASWRDSGWESTGHWPDSWGADQRDDFNEPRLLHLSLGRKALNSLTWDIQFSLIHSNLLTLQLSGLVYKIPVYPALPPRYLFWAYVIWEAVSQAEVLSVVHQIQRNSQLLGCAFFFSFNTNNSQMSKKMIRRSAG